MKRLFLMWLMLANVTFAGLWVSPAFVGNGSADSVIVSFCTFDTTYYPRVADADSIIALRYSANNQLLDSITQTAVNLLQTPRGLV